MLRWWPLPLAVVLIVGTGVAHGLWSQRWSATQDLQAAVERVAQVPRSVGDWDGSDIEDDTFAKYRAEFPGCLQRRFVQRGTQQTVTVALVCGRPGPVSVHTPEVCYVGNGYRMTAARARLDVGAEKAPFWKASFVKDSIAGRDELRVYWSWYTGTAWQAAGEPRLAFARLPSLYKLYVIYRVPSGVSAASDPGPAFLGELIPQLNRVLAGEG